MRRSSRNLIVILVATVSVFLLSVLAGCECNMSVTGKAFYPKENGDNVWKSRQATVERPIWSFGNAGNSAE